MEDKLSVNGLERLIDLDENDIELQVLEINIFQKKNKKGELASYYKVVLSDGFAKQTTIFADEAATIIQRCDLPIFSIIQVKKKIVSISDGKIAIVILEFSVIRSDLNEQIGEPIKFLDYKNNQIHNYQINPIQTPFSSKEKDIFQPQPNRMMENFSSKNKEEIDFFPQKQTDNFLKKYVEPKNAFKTDSSSHQINQNQEFYKSPAQNTKKIVPVQYVNPFEKTKEKDIIQPKIIPENFPKKNEEEIDFFQQKQTDNLLKKYEEPKNQFKEFKKDSSPYQINQNKEFNKSPFPDSKKIVPVQYLNPFEKTNEKILSNKKQYTNDDFFLPIKSLTQISEYWKIKAKILKKFEKRSFQKRNSTLQGSILRIQLIDKEGDQITGIFFNEDAERFDDFLIEGKVYGFSKGYLQKANSKFAQNENELEIKFDGRAEIVPLDDEEFGQSQKFKFKKIADINKMDPTGKEKIDLIGVICDVENVVEMQLKAGGSKNKRSFRVYDETDSVSVTLWGKEAEIDFQNDEIVVFRNMYLKTFNGMNNINASFDTIIIRDEIQNIPEALFLFEFKNNNKINPLNKNKEQRSNNKLYTIKEILDDSEAIDDYNPKKFFECYATIANIDDRNMFYISCINEKCRKKVIEEEENVYKCDSCHKEFDKCKIRYTLKGKIFDHTGSIDISMFDEIGILLLGIQADEIKDLKDRYEENIITEILKKPKFQQIKGKIMGKLDHYQGETRVKYTLISIYQNSFTENIKEVLKEIEQYRFK